MKNKFTDRQIILRYPDLKKMLNISRATLDRWENSGDFPKRIHLGKNSIGWLTEEVLIWIKTLNKK
jgi:prophage regulatory protein